MWFVRVGFPLLDQLEGLCVSFRPLYFVRESRPLHNVPAESDLGMRPAVVVPVRLDQGPDFRAESFYKDFYDFVEILCLASFSDAVVDRARSFVYISLQLRYNRHELYFQVTLSCKMASVIWFFWA